ncbi:NAC domain [Dillenia turbinata]|uniref:NAC domain n=1 Tax=Dillenia turbinata TaxID=194707 RepID=A0AAN8WCP6_9MAGN
MTNSAFVLRLVETGSSLSHPPTQEDLSYFETLPPGFRFKPSDQELIQYYLKNKVEGRPLPPNKIIDDDIYLGSPENLLEKYKKIWSESECYFFTPRNRKYKNGNRPDRRALDGYWKATGSDKLIRCGDTVGYKRSLVYYKGNTHHGNKTDWLMQEYMLRSNPIKKGTSDMRLDDVVLCKIYKKVAKGEKGEKAECGADQGGVSSAPDTSDNGPNEANRYLNLLFEDEFPYSVYNVPWELLFDDPKPPTL